MIWVWSYASHDAQLDVTTSLSTRCDCFARDYLIYSQLVDLSSSSVPTLCLKDPRSRIDTLQLDLLLTIRWNDSLATQKNGENPLLINNKDDFYWNTFVRQ